MIQFVEVVDGRLDVRVILIQMSMSMPMSIDGAGGMRVGEPALMLDSLSVSVLSVVWVRYGS